MQLSTADEKGSSSLSSIAEDDPSLRSSSSRGVPPQSSSGATRVTSPQASSSSSNQPPPGSQELDDRDFTMKFAFDDEGPVNANISPRGPLSDDMYSSLPETSPVEGPQSSPPFPQATPVEFARRSSDDDNGLGAPQFLAGETAPPPLYTPFDQSLDGLTAPDTRLHVVMMVLGCEEEEVKAFVNVGKWLRGRCGHRVRVATHYSHERVVKEGGLEFYGMKGVGANVFASEKEPLQAKGSEALRRWKEGLPDTLQSCWKSCIEPSEEGRAFIADAIVANPQSLAHIHCAESLGVPVHLLSSMPWTPTRDFPHPLARVDAASVDSAVTNLLSYAVVETMLWQQSKSIVNGFRKDALGLEPIESPFLPASLHGLSIPTTYLNSAYVTTRPADWADSVAWLGQTGNAELAAKSIHNTAVTSHEPCRIFPNKVVTLRSKQTPFPISAEAAAVLVKAKILSPARLHLYRKCKYGLSKEVRDPVTGVLASTSKTAADIALGATAGPREAYRLAKKPSNSSSSQATGSSSGVRGPRAPDDTHPYEAVALSTAKGLGQVITTAFKTPVTVTDSLAKGFHNAPRLYGDDTVREAERVTGWRSGLTAAGKGFGQGLYDGVAGFMTQPIRGAQKEGGVGFLKGFAKGVGGLALKPAAGAVGLPAHTIMGIYKEVQKVGKSNTEAYVVACRLAACDEEVDGLEEANRVALVAKWEAMRKEAVGRS